MAEKMIELSEAKELIQDTVNRCEAIARTKLEAKVAVIKEQAGEIERLKTALIKALTMNVELTDWQPQASKG